jgi:hypothetical protein
MSSTTLRARPQRNAERRFFSATAIVGLLIVVIGFTPTWFMMQWFNAPPLPWIVHLHGVVFTTWSLLYAAQTTLVAADRRDLHRKLGVGGAILGPGLLILGVAVAIEGAQRGAGGPGRDQLGFLIYPLANIAAFAVLLTTALLMRSRSAYHKRLMLLTMLPILTTPLARIGMMAGSPLPPPLTGMLLADFFLVALAVHDGRTLGKLHPATLWGGGALLASELARVIIGKTEAWRALARQIVG